jgi:hypothetical protein
MNLIAFLRCAQQAGLGDIPAEKLERLALEWLALLLKTSGLKNVPDSAHLRALANCRAPQAADLRPLAISREFEMLDWRLHPPPVGQQMICGSAGLGTAVIGIYSQATPKNPMGHTCWSPLPSFPPSQKRVPLADLLKK